jgi:thiol-disulfide isomerase/thioredoxin
MPWHVCLFLLLCSIATDAHAQRDPPRTLNVGDPAPRLQVRQWIKGTPIRQFEKGKVYVVEFWATWCRPCIAGMPHLSAMARKYQDNVTVIGVDIYEKKGIGKVRSFVDSMGPRMDYVVAREDSNFMETGWMDAFEVMGIPKSFVVSTDGRIAWIGHPKDLDEVLRKIVNNTWDISAASAKWVSDKYLAALDDSASSELFARRGDPQKPNKYGHQDSALLLIDEMVRKEPKLKYAPKIGFYTFSSLLQIDQQKACDYGKVLMVTPTYEDAPCDMLIDAIQLYSYKLNLRPELYELCAEAYQGKIDQYPQSDELADSYHRMAEWYWRACNKAKAVEAEQKAIEEAKNETDFPAVELTAFESRLRQYKLQ